MQCQRRCNEMNIFVFGEIRLDAKHPPTPDGIHIYCPYDLWPKTNALALEANGLFRYRSPGQRSFQINCIVDLLLVAYYEKSLSNPQHAYVSYAIQSARHTRADERDETSNEANQKTQSHNTFLCMAHSYWGLCEHDSTENSLKANPGDIFEYHSFIKHFYNTYFYYVQLHHRNGQMDNNTLESLLLAHPVCSYRTPFNSTESTKQTLYRCEWVQKCALLEGKVKESVLPLSQQIIIRLLSGYKWV